MSDESVVVISTTQSFQNNPDLSADFNSLGFGRGTITIGEAPIGVLKGTIGDTGCSLDLNGSINYGDPYCFRFQGIGVVGGEEWIYDCIDYVIKPRANGVNQVPAMTGSIVCTIPHSHGSAPAGVVCSWIAVRQGALK